MRHTMIRLPLSIAAPLVFAAGAAAGEKQLYWPNEFNNYAEVSLDRSAESDNFAVFWGTRSGDDPTQAPPGLRFNPASVLAQLESAYDTYIDGIGFLDDTTGNLAQHKIVIVMNETWNDAPWTGWAFGGSYDNTIGAMWVHPDAVVDPSFTLAHEFAHALQAQASIDHPGHGFINYEPTGSFWETHAQFMAEQHYPTILGGTDYIRFFNTAHFFWASTRHHYGNPLFLRYLQDTFGIELVNRLWRESSAGSETPIDTLKRIEGMSQGEVNDHFGRYAMKNVIFDYANGDQMRHTVNNELDRHMMTRRFTALAPLDGQPGAYRVPDAMAPQDYGYNLVQLQPDAPNGIVTLTFFGNENTPAGGSGHRFGLVAVNEDAPGGRPAARYSPLYAVSGGEELTVRFMMRPQEETLTLVVLGAPDTHHPYVWEPGWPKIYRYPWQIRLSGATPFVNNHRGLAGAPHPNGGGFVASSAFVEPGVYVGPDAVIAGNARVTGNAYIDGQASLTWNAVVSDNARVLDAAYVGWANVSGNAILNESAMQFGDAGGTYRAGGDAEGHAPCFSGRYRQTPHPNNGRSACDGLTSHVANADINPPAPDHVFPPHGCNAADLAAPLGVLDLADITGFVSGFQAGSPAADMSGDGVHDLLDLQLFLTRFVDGCP